MTTLAISLFGSLVTAVQIVLFFFRGSAACIGDGCRIVENLTTVPPIVFNLAGFLFFQVVFWGWLLDRKDPGGVTKTVKVLLLAGLACEGVLVSFQYYISEVFCLYCLIILALIVLLNFSVGTRQLSTGLIIFAAVFVVFSSLQFKAAAAGQSGNASLTAGTYGLRPAQGTRPQVFLFFSSSCLYCEKIIETMKEQTGCTIRLQPLDEIKEIDFPGLQLAPSYSSEVNRNFLKTLDIEEVPVLMARGDEGIRILKGVGQINRYLDQNCSPEHTLNNGTSSTTTGNSSFLPQQSDDSCSVQGDCEEPSSQQSVKAR